MFEPTFLSFEASTGLLEGMQTEITFEGKPLGSYFTIMMINDDWEGPDDDKNFCAIVYDVSGAELDSSCTSCWAGASWSVDTSMLVGTAGECDKLDPDDWTDDPVAYLSEGTYGFGFGTFSSAETAFQDALESGFGTYWSEYSDNVFVNYIKSDLSGTATWYNMAYAFGFEIDSSGAIVGDGSTMITVGDSAFAPDGFYSGSFFYGFSLQ